MLGLNLLNFFQISRFFETTTILWLRFVALGIVAVGGYLMHLSSDDGSPWYLKYISYLILIFGIVSFILFLMAGYYYTQNIQNSCVYCPADTLKMDISLPGRMLQKRLILPSINPYTNTTIYYFVIDRVKGDSSSDNTRLLTKNYHYDVILDAGTGNFTLNSVGKSQDMGKYPLQGLVQLAIVQEQKQFVVYINGQRRGSLETPELPSTISINSSPIFNPDGIIQDGILYHMELHSKLFDTETLKRHYEAITIQYTNDSSYQGTQLPKSNNMTFTQRFIGFIRMLSQSFGYSNGVSIAMNSLNSH